MQHHRGTPNVESIFLTGRRHSNVLQSRSHELAKHMLNANICLMLWHDTGGKKMLCF